MKLITAMSSRIIQLCRQRGWSEYKLASESGIPHATISNIVLKKCKSCNFDTIINICRGFKIELNEFLSPLFLLENLDDDD